MIRNSSLLILLAMVMLLVAGGCKSKKQAMQASNAAREKARIEQEAAARKQKEAELAKQKEAEERARLEREALAPKEVSIEPKEVTMEASLSNFFNAISSAGSVSSANSSIQEALSLFTSPETPVLIVISDQDGQKDYDRPTTIQQYLHYLKDQKKNINAINNLKFDSAGKITELELRKN